MTRCVFIEKRSLYLGYICAGNKTYRFVRDLGCVYSLSIDIPGTVGRMSWLCRYLVHLSGSSSVRSFLDLRVKNIFMHLVISCFSQVVIPTNQN